LKIWLLSVESQYHSVNAELLSSPHERLPEEKGPAHWPSSRFTHIIQLREEALVAARQMWADFIWVSVQLDQMSKLVKHNKFSDVFYSDFIL
jgi:collagen beta-1,O-galactosyltransferase